MTLVVTVVGPPRHVVTIVQAQEKLRDDTGAYMMAIDIIHLRLGLHITAAMPLAEGKE